MTAYRFMKANQNRYAIKEMAGLFGVSRGAYYKWARNGVSRRREASDAELISLIEGIVKKHLRRYGSPRVRQELLDKYGKRVSRKKVARLMRENGLNARGGGSLSRRRTPDTTFLFMGTYLTGSFMPKEAGRSGYPT